ncbi:hypothetical protein HKX48_004888 [Thoreauomyces humboldtii]|nr:hypothetical protein HKX48_004888 [Thoreauomyces humboldtii]
MQTPPVQPVPVTPQHQQQQQQQQQPLSIFPHQQEQEQQQPPKQNVQFQSSPPSHPPSSHHQNPCPVPPPSQPQKDGPRVQLVRHAFSTALSKCLADCSYEKLAQAFPSLARKSPDALRSARDQLVEFIRDAVTEEFEDVNNDRSLTENLNTLDQVILAAQASLSDPSKTGVRPPVSRLRGGSQRPSGTDDCMYFRVTAEQSVRAHAVRAKRAEVARLNAVLEEEERRNALVVERIQAGRTACQAAREDVEALMRGFVGEKHVMDGLERVVDGGSVWLENLIETGR